MIIKIFLDVNNTLNVEVLNTMSSTGDPSISNLMYIPYYMPDVNFNKVLYSNNIVKNGSILISDPGDGIIDLNQKYIDNFTNDYVYTPNVQSTVWNMNNTFVNNNLQYYFNGTKSNTQQSTRLGQTGIKNFNYNIIFGLTQADTSVIDWNYYGTGGITGGVTLTDRIYSKLGPKLFLVNNGNYTDGTVDASGIADYTVTNAPNSINNAAILNNINGMTVTPVDPSLSTITINDNTTLSSIYEVWPYKVQYNDNQYYSILTNGMNEALLALPKVNITTATQYLLTTKLNSSTLDPEYSYTDLGDIIQNNYHYIVSYFDTRPTVNKNSSLNFSSLTSSLFNENLVQFMPLTNFNASTCKIVHANNTNSIIASCIPVAWTTTQPLAFPNTPLEDLGALSPIRLEWGKNITIQTEVNYTCANMKNLSEILTGWNYYGNNFSPASSTNTNTTRMNVPYINCGLVLYVPNANKPAYNNVYEGLIRVPDQSACKIYCNINETERTIVSYYVKINGQNIPLAVTPDANNNYLPTVKSLNGIGNNQYLAEYETTIVDLNGIFYKIDLYQKNRISDNIYFKDIPTIINSNFTAIITLTNNITVPCNAESTDTNIYNISFNLAGQLQNMTYSTNSSDNIITVGYYHYNVNVNNINTDPTVTITMHKDADTELTTTVIDSVNTITFTDSSLTAINWYTTQSDRNIVSGTSSIQKQTYNIPIYCSYVNSYFDQVDVFLYYMNNETYVFNNPTTSYSNVIPLSVLSNSSNDNAVYYYIVSSPSTTAIPYVINNFCKYKNWLQSFLPNNVKFWNEISNYGDNNDILSNEILENYITNIYNNAVNHVNGVVNSNTETTSSIQYVLSSMCCLPFDYIPTSPIQKMYNNHLFTSTNEVITTTNNFLDVVYNFTGQQELTINSQPSDIVKLVNVLSVPITNALNTTHTATDTMTFRFEKPSSPPGVLDYYYIIGIYIYITKGLDNNIAVENPHYIGFSPSTNIINTEIMANSDKSYNGLPQSLGVSMVKNTTNLYENDYQTSILMKDYLVTPSVFMSINESTGNNL